MPRRIVCVLVALAATATACGQDAPANPGAAPAATASSAASTGATTDATPEALRFTAPLVGGGQLDLAGYAGQPVLLWFWAPY